MPPLTEIVLRLDADDAQTVREYFAAFGAGGRQLPEGDSNDEGAMLAEAIRDLTDYRDLYAGKNPTGPRLA